MTDFRATPKSRREMLAMLGGLGAGILVAGCGSDGASSAGSTTSTKAAGTSTTTPTTGSTATATVTACAQIPNETAGPFPGDGTNGPNILTQDGVVRSDITSSIGAASGTADGVPLTIGLTIVGRANGCAALPGAAVYVWQCDMDGDYSMYSDAIVDENYLRGVQVSDATGLVTFTSIFPAAYAGRWPHIHFEVFSSLAQATNGANAIAVSQLALPARVCRAVYATDGYEQSVSNLAHVSLQSDMVFSDGVSLQTPTITGDPTNGYTAGLVVAV